MWPRSEIDSASTAERSTASARSTSARAEAHAIEQGWAENHPMAARGIIPRNVVMVHGPRDTEELEIVNALVTASHEFAHAG